MSDTISTSWDQHRYLEDYATGTVYEFGSIAVSEDDVIAFAQRFDPQPFHIDPHAAKQSIFGGLIASGWHTASLTMRLLVDHAISRDASLGSPGIDELRWLKPVRPGDTLSVRVTILGVKRSKAQPDRGIVRSYVEVLNQNRDVVMTMKPAGLLLSRNTCGRLQDK